jgi:hypothetical protein
MSKARTVSLSESITKLLKETSLELRIHIACWFALNDMIHESGAREEAVWDESNPRDAELMKLLGDRTKELTESILNNIKEWELDGKPE